MYITERWRDLTKNNRTEGNQGVKSLAALTKTLGYGDNHGLYESDPLIAFLCDNPGAIENLFTWIDENVNSVDNWLENVYSNLPYVEPEIDGDTEECPDCECDNIEQLEDTEKDGQNVPVYSCKQCGQVWFVMSENSLKG